MPCLAKTQCGLVILGLPLMLYHMPNHQWAVSTSTSPIEPKTGSYFVDDYGDSDGGGGGGDDDDDDDDGDDDDDETD